MDFEALVAKGRELAQRLAGDEWTDYNEHDPGVTMLEALAYALTDVGYRASHPDADLFLGGATDHVASARAQGIVTGLEALPCAPVTTLDYRELLYSKVIGLQNAWLTPAVERLRDARRPTSTSGPSANGHHSHSGSKVEGLVRVHVELVHLPSIDAENLAVPSEVDAARVCADAARVLHGHRNLGEDFAWPTLLTALPLELHGTVEIDASTDAHDVIAQMLHEVQQELVPAPYVISADRLIENGVAPDEIFDGPARGLGGPVQFPHFAWPHWPPAPTRILRAIARVTGIVRVQELRIRLASKPLTEGEQLTVADEFRMSADGARWVRVDGTAHDGPSVRTVESRRMRQRRWIPVVGVSWPAECSVRVVRSGVAISVRPQRVREAQTHIRERWRQSLAYATTRLNAQDYARLPEARDRGVARYRSVQHALPATYGVGAGGVPEVTHWQGMIDDPRAVSAAMDRRRAHALQLKAYLVPFEQLIADQLAQLAEAGTQFSLAVGDSGTTALRTYATAPLLNDPPHEGDIPLLAQVLHGDHDAPIRAGTRARDLQRRESMLDHLLSRHGERFDAESVADGRPMNSPEQRLARKSALLAGLVAADGPQLGRDRGVAIDYRFGQLHVRTRRVDDREVTLQLPPATAIERRLEALAGIASPVHVLESVLLRPRGREFVIDALDGSPQRVSFYGSRAAVQGLVIDEGVLRKAWDTNASRRDHPLALRLGAGHCVVFHAPVADVTTFLAAIAAFTERHGTASPLRRARSRTLPYALYVVRERIPSPNTRLPEEDIPTAVLDQIIRENCPAHLTPRLVTLPPLDMHTFERLYSVWLKAWYEAQAAASSSTQSGDVQVDGVAAVALAAIDVHADRLRQFLARYQRRARARAWGG